MWVWGRSRVPFPANGMIAFMGLHLGGWLECRPTLPGKRPAARVKYTIPWSTACALAACQPAGTQETPEPFSIVTGGGEARIATDRSRLDFMVETQAVSAQMEIGWTE
jgi:hypothetical protein